MTIRRLKPLAAKYHTKFYGMAEQWAKKKRRAVPQIEIRTCSHGYTRGEAKHNPPRIILWVDEDETYATYLFLHELGHIQRGQTPHYEESHGDRFLRNFYSVINMFDVDREYMVGREAEYVLRRMTVGTKDNYIVGEESNAL